MATGSQLRYIPLAPWTFVVLGAGVLLGEMMPVKVSRRGSEEELTLSASFAMALLLAGGLVPAMIAQGIASVIQDLHSGKPWWRIRFNLGQYALAMASAELVMQALSVHHLARNHPFATAQLPAMILGIAAFFVVNTSVVGIAISLHQGTPIRRYFRTNLPFTVITAGAVLLVAPIVLAAAAYSVAIVPLCLAPMVAMYNTVSRSARSDHAARHDPLTGLPNRTACHEAITTATEYEHVPAAVLLMDLDRFKEVNDTLGHRYGDLLLVQVADRFQTVVGRRGQIARLGGDEFAVVTSGIERSDSPSCGSAEPGSPPPRWPPRS